MVFFFSLSLCCDAVILTDDGLINDGGNVDLAAAVTGFWSGLINDGGNVDLAAIVVMLI